MIDGSNLGGATGGRRGARDAVAVVQRLQPWARGRRERLVVVFDGAPDPAVAKRYGALEVAWSGAGRSADDEIVRRLEASARGSTAADWVVVTNDRELARRCREAGARVEGAAELVEQIERRSAPRAPGARRSDAAPNDKPAANAEEREHWRGVFGKAE